jgi:hypothetical protein
MWMFEPVALLFSGSTKTMLFEVMENRETLSYASKALARRIAESKRGSQN